MLLALRRVIAPSLSVRDRRLREQEGQVVLPCLREHDGRCIRRALSRLDREGLAERDLVLVVLDPALADHVRLVPADFYRPDRERLRLDALPAGRHNGVVVTRDTRRARKAR